MKKLLYLTGRFVDSLPSQCNKSDLDKDGNEGCVDLVRTEPYYFNGANLTLFITRVGVNIYGH